jgi:endoglucanase
MIRSRTSLLCLWFLCFSGPTSADEGYLPNGAMTEGRELPTGWRAADGEEGSGEAAAARDTEIFKVGPASLRLSVTGGTRGSVTCPLPDAAGKEVAITGWVRAEGKLTAALLAFVCPGAEQPWQPIKQFPADANWRRIKAKLKLPAGSEAPFLMLQLQGEGRAWLDEVAVLPGEQFRPEPLVSEFDGPPLFAFLAWEKRATPLDGGLRIKAPSGQGGATFALGVDASPFADRTPALTVTAGRDHQAQSILAVLQDADGTAHEFSFNLGGIAPGATATVTAGDGASLAEPGKVTQPGKQEGFDSGHLTQLTVQGDWKTAPVDLTLHKLELVEPTAEILAARTGLRERLAVEAAARQKAEAQRAARVADLLWGAPHQADGPDVQHVAAVAPDVLALSVQERQFLPAPQVDYRAEPGDEIQREGKEKVPVVKNGKVLESPIDMVVVRNEGNRKQKIGHLAINANRLKPEDTATGRDLTDETVAEPNAYRIVLLGDAGPASPLTPTAVWWKRKPNAYRSLAHAVEIYLKLPRPLVAGRTYRVEFPGVNFRQAAVEYRHEPSQVRSPAVHVGAIGFRPDDPFKRAYLSVWLGTGDALHYGDDLRFQLLDDATGRPVFSGPVRLLAASDAKESFKAGRNYAKTDVLGMDFSAFDKPGRYRVCVQGIGCSYPVEIAEDVWTRAFQLSMKGLLHERSGIELGPPFTDFRRPRNMHPADGVKVFASAGAEIEGGGQDGIFRMLMERRTDRLLPDAWGGHMDAGDWDRNSRHPAAMWLLVDLCELFPDRIGAVKLALPPAEANNAVPDVLDEVLWNLDLYRRLQTPDGGVGGGIESTSHPRPGEASWQESLLLSAYAPDPQSSYIYAATAAKLARALADSDAPRSTAYAASARRAWDWATTHGDDFLETRIDENRRAQVSEELGNQRNLAAFELWRLSGQSTFHDEFRATTVLGGTGNPMEQHKAVVSYARLPDGQGDAALRDAARQWVLQMADTALAFADGNAFGVTTSIPQLPPMGFVGYLSTPEMIGAVLPHAWLLTRDPKYLAGAVRACQFSSGANPDNQALTTGLGPNPVRFPLYIDSWVTGQPAPAGITVYGISDPAENYDFDGWAHTWYLQKMVPPSRSWPAHESYWDIYTVPSSNEFTIHQTIIPTAFYWGFLAARDGIQ